MFDRAFSRGRAARAARFWTSVLLCCAPASVAAVDAGEAEALRALGFNVSATAAPGVAAAAAGCALFAMSAGEAAGARCMRARAVAVGMVVGAWDPGSARQRARPLPAQGSRAIRAAPTSCP